jgi:transcriptional regulator with XRE-family HTH domain
MATAVSNKTLGKNKKGRVKATGTVTRRAAVPSRPDYRRPAAALTRDRPPKVATAGMKAIGGKMTAEVEEPFAGVQQARGRLGLTQPEFGRVIGCSTRSVAGWEADATAVKSPARRRIVEADRLGIALAQIIPSDEVGPWLRTPNPAFEGQTPLQVVERGEADRLWQMIRQIDAGVAS